MSEILNKFEICSNIDVNLKNNIKLFHVFKDTNKYQCVIFVTNDDRVYWIKSTSKPNYPNGAFPHPYQQFAAMFDQPINISVLNNKKIDKFVIDQKYIVAISSENGLFVGNISGQNIHQIIPMQVITSNGIQIKQVCIGREDGVILFENGQVYHFKCSMSSNMREKNAKEIIFSGNIPTGTRAIKILSNANYNMWVALLDNGKVYRWMNNYNNYYDYEDNYSIHPTISINALQTEGNVIDICNQGVIFFLLINNNRIQCGEIRNSRFELFNFVNSVQFGSTINNSLKSLSSYNQDVIAEGDCCVYSLHQIAVHGPNRPSLNKTNYINKFEFFEKVHQITYETVVLEENVASSSRMSLSGDKPKNLMEKAFDNKEFYDLKFKLQKRSSKGKSDYIYVHKWVIKQNSQYFERMFANEWKESVSNEIQINGYSYEAYYQYLRWLYTDLIDSSDVEVLIEMLSLSDEYLENQLKVICEERIKKSANLQNICVLYSKANELNAKELEKFSFNLIKKNIKRVIEMNEFKAMDKNIANEMLVQYIRQQ